MRLLKEVFKTLIITAALIIPTVMSSEAMADYSQDTVMDTVSEQIQVVTYYYGPRHKAVPETVPYYSRPTHKGEAWRIEFKGPLGGGWTRSKGMNGDRHFIFKGPFGIRLFERHMITNPH